MHVRGLERGRYLCVSARRTRCVLRAKCEETSSRKFARFQNQKRDREKVLPAHPGLRGLRDACLFLETVSYTPLHSGSSPSHGVSSRQQIAEFAAAAVLLTLQRLGDLQLLVERLLALHNTCHVAHTPERPGRGGSCVALRVGRIYRGAEQGSRHGSPVGHNRRPSRVIAAICAVS